MICFGFFVIYKKKAINPYPSIKAAETNLPRFTYQELVEATTVSRMNWDIKPHNILLDDYYDVKIVDFGLAKLLMMNQSRTNIGIRGAKGYAAPEWFRNTWLYSTSTSQLYSLKKHSWKSNFHNPIQSQTVNCKHTN